VENIYTAYNFSHFAIYVPKLIKVRRNLTNFWQKQKCSFFRHCVYSCLHHSLLNLNRFAYLNRFAFLTETKMQFFFETLCIQLFASQPAQLKQVKLLKQCVKFVFAIEPLCDVRWNQSFIPYVRDLSLTFGKSCVLGVESKLLLNNVSISVDLPMPVSPADISQQHNNCTIYI